MTKHEKEMLDLIENKAIELDIFIKRIKVRRYEINQRYETMIIVKDDAVRICQLYDYIDSIDDDFGHSKVYSTLQAKQSSYKYE